MKTNPPGAAEEDVRTLKLVTASDKAQEHQLTSYPTR